MSDNLPTTPQTYERPAATHPLDPDIIAKHRESVLRYPELSLSPGEYVIESVRRHPIGLLSIWFVSGFLIIMTLALLPFYALNLSTIAAMFAAGSLPSPADMSIPVFILAAFFALGGVIATIVYQGNRFYLTNESVIQHVRPSLFHTKTQIINLVNVEDASFDQRGILQQVLSYGTIRLSTQGQETIYHFYFVSNPPRVINAVNSAIEIAMRNLEGDLRMHQIRE